MPASDTASRITPFIDQLLEDESARRDLRRGADKLRDAYERSQKRRVKATRDEKKPKKRRRKLLKLLTVAAVGVGVAVALNDDLRSSVLGSGSGPGQDGGAGSS